MSYKYLNGNHLSRLL